MNRECEHGIGPIPGQCGLYDVSSRPITAASRLASFPLAMLPLDEALGSDWRVVHAVLAKRLPGSFATIHRILLLQTLSRVAHS